MTFSCTLFYFARLIYSHLYKCKCVCVLVHMCDSVCVVRLYLYTQFGLVSNADYLCSEEHAIIKSTNLI